MTRGAMYRVTQLTAAFSVQTPNDRERVGI